jgi:putative transposase
MLPFIGLNLVAAGMVDKPEQYRWSSYPSNALGKAASLVPHDEYLNLGSDVESRCYAYREIFGFQLSEYDIHLIERASEYCYPVGDDRFRQQIEERCEIRIGQSVRGKPKKVIDIG